MMKSMLPFGRIATMCTLRGFKEGHRTLTVDRDGFTAFIRELLKGFEFDEDFYLEQNPDVRKAVEAGNIKDAMTHYLEIGYFEGRHPRGLNRSEFDEAFYLEQNPDVRQAVEAGIVKDGMTHYLQNGRFEGRHPTVKAMLGELASSSGANAASTGPLSGAFHEEQSPFRPGGNAT